MADSEARRIDLFDGTLSVLAVPDTPALPALVKNPAAKYNVLLLHGVVPGVLPDWFTSADKARTEVSIEDLTKADWDYVALGHYHVYTRVYADRNIYYSGAIDYTGPSAWGELYQRDKHAATIAQIHRSAADSLVQLGARGNR